MEINQVKFAKVVEAAKAKAAGYPEWLRAIEKAAAAILSGKMIVTTLADGALVTTDGGTYKANGACNCAARTRHCYHRAGARLIELYEAEPDAPAARIGYLGLDGWAGRREHKVEVVGETPKKYRIRAIARTKLAGRCRYLEPGETALVPRYAIRLEQEPDAPALITRSVERDVITRRRIKVVRCDGWTI